MKIGFFADLHVDNYQQHGGALVVGLNNRCRLTLAVLDRALATAKKAGCAQVWSLGDLFNGVRPTPQVISAVQEIILRHCAPSGQDGMTACLLSGNHEQVTNAPGDNALAPLRPMAHVVDTPSVRSFECNRGVEVWAVPSLPGEVAVDGIQKWFKTLPPTGKGPAPRRLLVLHVGIVTADTPEYLRDASDAVLEGTLRTWAREYGFTAVLAGNWHRRAVLEGTGDDNCIIIQMGAMGPRGWNDEGLEGYGTLLVYDSVADDVEWVEVPGPRFITTRTDQEYAHALEEAVRRKVLRLYVHRLLPPGAAVEEAKVDTTVGDDLLVTTESIPDELEATVAARAAAQAVQGTSTVEEALASFVKAMPVEEGVNRTAVGERVRRLLAEVSSASA